MIKSLLKKYFDNFLYFYSLLKWRIIISLGLSLIVAVLDGFGLVMFLPLLQNVSDPDNQELTEKSMGNLSFIIDFLHYINLELSLQVTLGVMIVFFLSKGIVKFIEGSYSIRLRLLFMRTLRISVLDKLQDLKYSAFVQKDAGRIQNTMTSEMVRVLGGV